MLTWLFIKTLIGGALKKISSGLAWCIEHWKITLPALIVAVTIWQFHRVITERDAAITELGNYKAAVKTAQDQRKIENQIKKNNAASQLLSINIHHQNEIEQIKRNSDEKLHLQDANHTDDIQRWRERLRIELAKDAANGLPGIQQAAEGSAESGGNCDTAAFRKAYDTLEIACAVTTSDYNSLYESWSKACEIYGCE